MNDSVIIVKNAFSVDFCNMCLSIDADHEGTVGGQERVNQDIRRSRVKFLEGIFYYFDIYRDVISVMKNVNNEFYNFDLVSIQPPQLTEYDSAYQGEYKPHADSDLFGDGGLIRKLSMSVQITPPENYEGGLLEFPESNDYDSANTIEQGTAVLFPSYVLHGVTPVTSGKRKSLVVWAGGPAFR